MNRPRVTKGVPSSARRTTPIPAGPGLPRLPPSNSMVMTSCMGGAGVESGVGIGRRRLILRLGRRILLDRGLRGRGFAARRVWSLLPGFLVFHLNGTGDVERAHLPTHRGRLCLTALFLALLGLVNGRFWREFLRNVE